MGFKHRKHKVPGFTLIEMMVALAISSLVIIMAMSAYQILHRQFANFQQQSEGVNDIYTFVNTLENDLEHYHLQAYSRGNFMLQKTTGKLLYHCGEQTITRQVNGKVDTLLAGIPHIGLDTVNTGREGGFMNITLFLSYDTLLFKSHFIKEKKNFLEVK